MVRTHLIDKVLPRVLNGSVKVGGGDVSFGVEYDLSPVALKAVILESKVRPVQTVKVKEEFGERVFFKVLLGVGGEVLGVSGEAFRDS